MTKDQFEHAVRAAAAVVNAAEVLVIGSQAVHGSTDQIIPEAERSMEADIAVLGDDEGVFADVLDGAIGELSMFQETFGFYVQGVTPNTAVLPRGWQERLVRYRSATMGDVTALCLEPHDLWLAKAVAGRPKDRAFCAALLDRGLVRRAVLVGRLDDVPGLDTARCAVLRALIGEDRE